MNANRRNCLRNSRNTQAQMEKYERLEAWARRNGDPVLTDKFQKIAAEYRAAFWRSVEIGSMQR